VPRKVDDDCLQKPRWFYVAHLSKIAPILGGRDIGGRLGSGTQCDCGQQGAHIGTAPFGEATLDQL
jgi:hypothetical protein